MSAVDPPPLEDEEDPEIAEILAEVEALEVLDVAVGMDDEDG